MPGRRLMILKLGGSVLRNEACLPAAVHEVYRWHREGWRMVVVVSALAGRTDDLLDRCRRLGGESAVGATAVAAGEMESAGLLELLLDRAGVPATVVPPAVAGLVAEGGPTEAEPVALDGRAVHLALARSGIVIVPGFSALDRDGTTVLLGRGGSDLTAVHLAAHLGADRCRLVKDVDGLYDRDPCRPDDGGHDPPPRRFDAVTFSTAMSLGGAVLQARAVDMARRNGIPLEVAGFNADRATSVGSRRDVASTPSPPRSPLTVALLGCGTVGRGVYEHLRRMPGLFRVVGVAVRDPDRHRDLPPHLLTRKARELAGGGADIVVEVMGGTGEAADAAWQAVRGGSHLVTANKTLLATSGPSLSRAAAMKGRRVLASAAVGGAVPLLEAVRTTNGARLQGVRGVLNGTTSFVLDRVVQGAPFAEAVREAQHLGYAEADPGRDLSGLDAVDKLRVLAQAAGGPAPAEEGVRVEPITRAGVARLVGSRSVPRHVATLERAAEGWRAAVRLQALEPDDPLARAPGPDIATTLEWEDGRRLTLRGRGAGRWPTAEAVVADLLELARARP